MHTQAHKHTRTHAHTHAHAHAPPRAHAHARVQVLERTSSRDVMLPSSVTRKAAAHEFRARVHTPAGSSPPGPTSGLVLQARAARHRSSTRARPRRTRRTRGTRRPHGTFPAASHVRRGPACAAWCGRARARRRPSRRRASCPRRRCRCCLASTTRTARRAVSRRRTSACASRRTRTQQQRTQTPTHTHTLLTHSALTHLHTLARAALALRLPRRAASRPERTPWWRTGRVRGVRCSCGRWPSAPTRCSGAA